MLDDDESAAKGSSTGGASLAASPKSNPKLAGLTGDAFGDARTAAGDGDGAGDGEAAAAAGVDALAADVVSMESACGDAAADALPRRPREVGVGALAAGGDDGSTESGAAPAILLLFVRVDDELREQWARKIGVETHYSKTLLIAL